MDTYDAGLLNDYGGGDVGWWQDYLRAELGRAEEFYRDQHDRLMAEKDAEIERLREALLEIEGGASPDHWVPQFQHCVDVAREALKGDSDE